MTDRAWVYEGTQIGIETVKGVAPAGGASKKLMGISVVPSVTTETDEFAPSGYKYNTVVINGKEWSTATIEGRGAFNDLAYLLAGMFGDVAPTTPSGGGTARQRVWTPASTSPDNPATLYIQNGSPTSAEAFTYGLMNALSMTLSRTSIEIGGSMLGQLITEGVTMTPSPTTVPFEPMLPAKANVYLDPDFADIGTTKLTRCMEASFDISDKFGVIWPINSSNTSWAAHVETKPTAGASITLGMGSQSSALLAAMRAGQPQFLRFEVIGPLILGAVNYQFWADFAVVPLSPGEKSDTDGLTTRAHELRIVHSSAWDKAMQFTLINTVATL